MSANEKLRSIAYAMGFTMTADQKKAYGELKGFPILLTVASEDEILAQFHANTNEPTAKQNIEADIDTLKADTDSVLYGSFSGEKANIGLNTQSPAFDIEYNATLCKIAESLIANHCKVICECCKEQNQVHAVAVDDKIQMTCDKCSREIANVIEENNTNGNFVLGMLCSLLAMAAMCGIWAAIYHYTEYIYPYLCVVLFPICYSAFLWKGKRLTAASIILCAVLSAITVFAMEISAFMTYGLDFDDLSYALEVEEVRNEVIYCYVYYVVGLIIYLVRAIKTAKSSKKKTFSHLG